LRSFPVSPCPPFELPVLRPRGAAGRWRVSTHPRRHGNTYRPSGIFCLFASEQARVYRLERDGIRHGIACGLGAQRERKKAAPEAGSSAASLTKRNVAMRWRAYGARVHWPGKPSPSGLGYLVTRLRRWETANPISLQRRNCRRLAPSSRCSTKLRCSRGGDSDISDSRRVPRRRARGRACRRP